MRKFGHVRVNHEGSEIYEQEGVCACVCACVCVCARAHASGQVRVKKTDKRESNDL